MRKLSIIIPVYNESKTLAKIVEIADNTILSAGKEIIIVDDGSTDGSREIITDWKNKYKIILQAKNSGKGAAVRAGLELATGDYTVIQDADLEYNPADFNKMIELADKDGWAAIYGSRNLAPNPHFKETYYYGGKLITFFTNLLFGGELTDVNTCYKMIKTDLLKSLALKQKGFSFCEEVTAKLLRKKIKIKEIPISYQPRKFGEGKKIRYYHGLKSLFTLLSCRFFK